MMDMKMKPKRKGIVAILGLGPKDGEEKDLAQEDEDLASHHEAAAEELISAVKGGDAKKVVKAFSAMYDLCAARRDEESGESEEEEASEPDEGDEGDHEYSE